MYFFIYKYLLKGFGSNQSLALWLYWFTFNITLILNFTKLFIYFVICWGRFYIYFCKLTFVILFARITIVSLLVIPFLVLFWTIRELKKELHLLLINFPLVSVKCFGRSGTFKNLQNHYQISKSFKHLHAQEEAH